MGLENTHLDVLQNIELGVVNVYRQRPELLDHEVTGALDELIAHYRAVARDHTLKPVSLEAREREIFDNVRTICDWRIGLGDGPANIGPLPGVTSAEDIVACLRKIRKSVDFWSRNAGRRGYLDFVSQHV